MKQGTEIIADETTWCNINGFPNHRISKCGKVLSVGREWRSGKNHNLVRTCSTKLMKTGLDHFGYEVVTIWRNKKLHLFKIHRLVAEHFIPNPENKPHVNHIDGNRLNNHVSNLEWVTPSENTRHAIGLGLIDMGRGETARNVKLTSDQVLEIRASTLPQTKIAEQYGITQVNVSRIKLKKTWRHL